MKFSTKLTLALIFAATVPVALAGYGISLLNEQILRQNAQEYYLLAAERTQEQVSTHIQEKARVLENVTNVLSTNSVEERAVMPVVKQLLADAPNVDALGVYDISGAMADAIVKERGTLIPARLQLTEVGISTSASFTLLDPIFPETAKMPSIPLVKPLVSNGRRIGYCVVFIKTEDLCGIVENISRRLFSGSPSKIRIVTDSLRLIAAYSRNAVQVSQNRGFASPLLNNSQFSFVGVLQDYSYSEGAEMLGAALSLPLLRSIVLVEEPRAVAFAAVRQIRWNTLWWVILCGVCGGLLGVLLSKQISKPLQELSEATSKLALRDFSATLVRERTDEFGGLFAKHNIMPLQVNLQNMKH
jgi:HAMP domain-containing protein